ncbi:hypothetical protein ACFL2R_01890 [Patescibacteria group bacterium]
MSHIVSFANISDESRRLLEKIVTLFEREFLLSFEGEKSYKENLTVKAEGDNVYLVAFDFKDQLKRHEEMVKSFQ